MFRPSTHFVHAVLLISTSVVAQAEPTKTSRVVNAGNAERTSCIINIGIRVGLAEGDKVDVFDPTGRTKVGVMTIRIQD